MNKTLLILSLILTGYSSAKAQDWFLGKTEKAIRDSLFKINYGMFVGTAFPDDQYEMQFMHHENNFSKDISTSPKETRDTLFGQMQYHFWFKADICVVSTIQYNNLKSYSKAIAYLDTHYKRAPDNRPDQKKWVDEVDMIEILLTKQGTEFSVSYHTKGN